MPSDVDAYRRYNDKEGEPIRVAVVDATAASVDSRRRDNRKEGRAVKHEIKVTTVANPKPNVRLYVLALIALAQQLQEEEEVARRGKER